MQSHGQRNKLSFRFGSFENGPDHGINVSSSVSHLIILRVNICIHHVCITIYIIFMLFYTISHRNSMTTELFNNTITQQTLKIVF